jgi:zinc and cadmium transporter
MADYPTVIFYSLIGGIFSLLGGILLMSRRKSASVLAKYATPFAAGALLSAVFLDLLHEGVEEANPDTVLTAALIGMVVFFLAERFLRWFHHHHQHGSDPTTSLVIAGDTIHNILDGIAIAAAFLVSVPTGIITTIAVAAHEIPQEIGDFGLLLHKGLSRAKVILVNIVSALATTVAAVITFAIGSEQNLPLGVLIGLSAGFLLYIAASDIIPEIHERTPKQKLFSWQPILLVIGVVVVAGAIQLAHKYIDDNGEAHHTDSCITYYDKDGATPLYEDCHDKE